MVCLVCEDAKCSGPKSRNFKYSQFLLKIRFAAERLIRVKAQCLKQEGTLNHLITLCVGSVTVYMPLNPAV